MKAVICGAGIAGLALAQRLDVLGWDVVLLEKAVAPRAQGYMIDFFGPGFDAAEEMGLLPRLRELGYEVTAASFVDESGRSRASLSFAQFGRTVRGRLLSILRPDLERALREHVPATVDMRFSTRPVRVVEDGSGVRVTLSDGSVLSADLLVGADGIHSAVRAQVFGEEREFLRYLGFHTAAYTFEDPDVQARVGDRFCLTDTVGSQMGLYGLRDGRVAVYAVHRTPDPALPTDARAAIRDEYRSLGWVVPHALAACPPAAEVYYDQVAQIEMPTWSRGSVTLVGDACHAVSLLAGQGASLAVAGSFVLAEQLSAAHSVEEGLRRYEKAWRPVVEEKQRVARDSSRWFLPRSAWQLHVRRIAMKLARLPGFDRLVAGMLAGKSTSLINELRAAQHRPTRTSSP